MTVNGQVRLLEAPTPLVRFLDEHGLRERKIAVDHNGTILYRSEYDAVTLNDGDVLEIIHPVGGGFCT